MRGGFPQNTEVRYSYSIDTGTSWVSSVAVSPSFDHGLGYPSQNKLGDYYDMISHEDAAHLAYAATFNGGQDVYYLRIAPDCNANQVHDGTDVLNGFSVDCNANGLPDECEFPGCVGIPLADLNCDGDTNGADIQPFVDVFAGGGYTCAADMNQNGSLESADTALFANALVAP